MSDETRFDLTGIVRREWWLVLLVVVIAVVVTAVATSGGAASYTGSGTVNVDYAVVNKFPTLFNSDRIPQLIQAPEYLESVSRTTGIPVDELKADLRTSAQGKFLDKVFVSYTADTEQAAAQNAEKVANAVIAYAGEVGAEETDRQAEIIAVNEAAVTRIKELLVTVRATGDPYQEADLLSKLALLESETINAKSALDQIEDAYTFDGTVKVTGGAASSLRLDAMAGALLVGLVAGLGLAILREWWLRRRPSAA